MGRLARLIGLGSKRARAAFILLAAVRALRAGRVLRAALLAVAAVLAWKYFLIALAVDLVLDALRGREREKGDEPPAGEAPETT